MTLLPTANPSVFTTDGSLRRVTQRDRVPMMLEHDMRLARRERTPDQCREKRRLVLSEFRQLCEEAGPDGRRNISLRSLFEHTMPHGRELIHYFEDQDAYAEYLHMKQVGLIEAGAVMSSDFSDFSNVLLSTEVKANFALPTLIGTQLTRNVPTRLRSERLPGISDIGDEAESIPEGEPYPYAGVGQDYRDTPQTIKQGLIVGVTREAIFFDRTGVALDRASRVGQALGIRKEKRIVTGVLGIINPWKPKDSHLSTQTYQTGAPGDAFNNIITSNPLDDWKNIDAILDLFRAMTDPRTGEPIVLQMNPRLLHPDSLGSSARRIRTATQFRTTIGDTLTIHGNPTDDDWEPISNRYVDVLGGSGTTWYYGDFQRAFMYMENWPIEVRRAPTNNYLEFERDIAFLYRASEQGVFAVDEPRYVARSVAA